jgi:hypothetical protein
MEADKIQGPVDTLSDYLDKLPGYDGSWNQIPLLNISRKVWNSENYYYYGIPFPTGPDIFFNQPGSGNVFQTFSGDITIPPFSILTSIQFFSAGTNGTVLNSGFKLRVYDKGGKVDLIQKQFALVNGTASEMLGNISGNIQPGQDDPFGPGYLLGELFVMPPGVLSIEITDLSGIGNNMIQILLNFACPLTSQGTNTQDIQEG